MPQSALFILLLNLVPVVCRCGVRLDLLSLMLLYWRRT